MKKTRSFLNHLLIIVFLACISCNDVVLNEIAETQNEEIQLRSGESGSCTCMSCANRSTCRCTSCSDYCTDHDCVFGHDDPESIPEGCDDIVLQNTISVYVKSDFIKCLQQVFERFGPNITTEEIERIIERKLYVRPLSDSSGKEYYPHGLDRGVDSYPLILDYFFVGGRINYNYESVYDALDNSDWVFAFRNGHAHPMVIMDYLPDRTLIFYEPRENYNGGQWLNFQLDYRINAVKDFERMPY